MFTVFIETDDESRDDVPMGAMIPKSQQVDADDPASIEIGSGSVVSLSPGEKAKEVKAAVMRVDNSFSTRDREAQEINGSDFYKNVKQRRGEERLMKEVAEVMRDGEPRPDD